MPRPSAHPQLTSIALLAAFAAGAPAACGADDGGLFDSSTSTSGAGVSTGSSGTTGAGGAPSTAASGGAPGASSSSGEGGASSASSSSGGVPPIVCATTDQCEQKLGDDPCKANIACDAATALCTYQTLDKDADGHPPIVCGGDDCNDNDASQFPGHAEACDGKDNNCNGALDDGATCAGLGTCQAGVCVCSPGNTCGAVCVDKSKDPLNCGTCNNKCPSASSCVNGKCECVAGASMCNGQCVNTQTDPKNCGGCNTNCSACQSGTCTPCAAAVDLFIEQDISGSMVTTTTGGSDRWTVARTGVNAFMIDPAAAGVGLGIGYFPVAQPCVTPLDCGTSGTCTNGHCTGTDSCKVSDYAAPVVAIGLLPGVQPAIQTSMNAQMPKSLSPQAPALDGALSVAKAYALAHAGHKVAVVLITDGLPNECTTSDIPTDVANIAAAYFTGSPQVRTFVVGIGNSVTPEKWNTIAAAGGTSTAVLAETPQQVQAALNKARATLSGCP